MNQNFKRKTGNQNVYEKTKRLFQNIQIIMNSRILVMSYQSTIIKYVKKIRVFKTIHKISDRVAKPVAKTLRYWIL